MLDEPFILIAAGRTSGVRGVCDVLYTDEGQGTSAIASSTGQAKFLSPKR
jgi:hypothetical protein